MPGQVTVTNATGAPIIPPGVDVAMCIVGPTPKSPVTAGQVSPPYGLPAAIAADFGPGDTADAAQQAVNRTPGNPAPPAVSLYATPATNPGTYGTINISGVTGTAVPANNTAIVPTGTLRPWIKVRTGFSVGTAGGDGWASLDGGTTQQLVQFGTAGEYNFPTNDGFAGQAGFVFGAPASTLSALYTALNNGRTAVLAHFLIVSGSPTIHAAADTADNTALIAIPTATTPATAVALFNGILALLTAHVGSAVYHTIADTVAAIALTAIPVAKSTEDVELHLVALRAAYEAHRVLVGGGPVHGSADSTNTWASYSAPAAATFIAGDVFYTNTLPPTPGSTDIYAAGTPATGALGAIASSSQSFALIVFPWPLTEAASTAVFAAAVAGMNNLLTYNKRPICIFQFRDQMLSGETTAQYVTAARSIMLGQDSRLVLCVGGGLLTDAMSARAYLRSGLPAVLARLQGATVFPGAEGEIIAQDPGWAGRGPLEGFSLVDGNGNLVFGAVDALTVGGLDGPVGAFGGALNFFHQRDASTAGAYVSAAPCMYGVGSTLLTLMDSRVAQALSRVLYSASWPLIKSASIVQSGILDPDVCSSIASILRDRLRTTFPHEFANPEDPNLVVVNPSVAVSGPNVTISIAVNDELFDYIGDINLTLYNARS